MELTEADLQKAERRMAAKREAGHAVSVRISFDTYKFIIVMDTGLELAVPFGAVDGLASASKQEIEMVEITPSGTGLIWPLLDAGLYIPSLLQSIAGSKNWLAKTMGASGGIARTDAKSLAARENGKKGGRPKKAVVA
jgi:Protein of unknown function (DUF2442)